MGEGMGDQVSPFFRIQSLGDTYPAPLLYLLDIKVLDNRGEGTEEEVVMGIDEVLSLHDEGSAYAPWVINLSLGGPDDGSPFNPLREYGSSQLPEMRGRVQKPS